VTGGGRFAGTRGAARLLKRLAADPDARLLALPDGSGRLVAGHDAVGVPVAAATLAALKASGLLVAEGDRLALSDAAGPALRRMGEGGEPFRAQHQTLGRVTGEDGPRLVNLDESPVGKLARPARGGQPFLSPALVQAAERLRADFERGQLQPRVTANWTAPVAGRRRSGEAGGASDLADSALAARRRLREAVTAIGPELAGPVLDVCCFLKGLESVERERNWPARSAKLVLRLGLEALARHYGLADAARGPERGRLTHWGAADYRPKLG